MRFTFDTVPAERTGPSSSSSCRNVTDVLMSSAQTLRLSKEIDSSANNTGDVRLYNIFMSNRSLGFYAGTEQTSGKQIVVALQILSLIYKLKWRPHISSLYYKEYTTTLHLMVNLWKGASWKLFVNLSFFACYLYT